MEEEKSLAITAELIITTTASVSLLAVFILSSTFNYFAAGNRIVETMGPPAVHFLHKQHYYCSVPGRWKSLVSDG